MRYLTDGGQFVVVAGGFCKTKNFDVYIDDAGPQFQSCYSLDLRRNAQDGFQPVQSTRDDVFASTFVDSNLLISQPM
jgi:hypothetical protein